MFFSFVNFWDSKQFSSISGKKAKIRLTSTQIMLEHWVFNQTSSKEKIVVLTDFKPKICTLSSAFLRRPQNFQLSSNCFDKSADLLSQNRWKIIFVAFSEKLNFTCNLNKIATEWGVNNKSIYLEGAQGQLSSIKT